MTKTNRSPRPGWERKKVKKQVEKDPVHEPPPVSEEEGMKVIREFYRWYTEPYHRND